MQLPRTVERSRHDRLLTGVAGGLAHRFGVPGTVVRVVLVSLSFAGGIGLVLYAVAYATSRTDGGDSGVATTTPASSPTPGHGLETQRTIALVCLTVAVLVLARSAGLWPGDRVMVPVVTVALGAIVMWSRQGAASQPFTTLTSATLSPTRIIAGVGLTLAGATTLAADGRLSELPRTIAALLLAVCGAAMLSGPWIASLVHQVSHEQRQRVRAEEKSELAAQLHDSVLQTLALMQRAGDDPRRMVMLARRQERELRSWLYDERKLRQDSLQGAIESMCAEVELDHDVRIDAVVVGDAVLDAVAQALVGAMREATVNAAKHAGVDQISVYTEVEPGELVAFVRDTGGGFHPPDAMASAGPRQGRGLTDSIHGRITRAGGTVVITSEPGSGTEIELRVPR